MCCWRIVLLALLPALLWARVNTGLDVLVQENFASLAGKRVGVVANENSLTSDHRSIVDVMAKSDRIKLTAIFGPEHGFSGLKQAGANVQSGTESINGVPIYSLYTHGLSRPTPAMLANVDVLVYDLQDVGARFWTYTTLLGYVLESAAKQKIPVFVLDRPNPLNGVSVEGPMLDAKYFSAIGYGRRPVRHGMTSGELAQFFNGENNIGANLHVVKMRGWNRQMWMDETGVEWINPSPNIRNLTEAILYPGTCLVENTRVSVGRGTNTPFQMIGAPWLKNVELADYLNAQNIPGVRFMQRRFTPQEDNYQRQEVQGLDVQLIDRAELDSPQLGLELLAALLKFHPAEFSLDRKIMLLLGNDQVAGLLKEGKSGREITAALQNELDTFKQVRAKYLLY